MGYRKTLILFVCLITYLCLGALAFIAMEQSFNSTLEARASFNAAVTEFARKHSSCGVTQDSLMTFMREHGRVANDRGVLRFDVDPSKGVQEEWSLANALVFTSEIVTTIGKRLEPLYAISSYKNQTKYFLSHSSKRLLMTIFLKPCFVLFCCADENSQVRIDLNFVGSMGPVSFLGQ